mmetsp:Transcript_4220/g.12551  ORF Transcript_4220/g.12551 Transcript_4220/m.12551 type:complete len:205 (+) Transcript_4220:162-776(+)
MSRPARDPQSRLCMCGTTPRQSYRWRRSLAWCSGAGSSTPRRARYATPCSPSSTSAPCAPSLTRGYALAPSPLPRLLCRTLRLGSLSRWPCYSREQVWIGREAFVSTPLPAACLKCRLGPGRADRPRAAPPYMPSAGHYIHTLHVVCMYKERELNFGGESRSAVDGQIVELRTCVSRIPNPTGKNESRTEEPQAVPQTRLVEGS